MWHWPAVGVARCYEAGLSQYMTEKFQAGLEVTTDYSGLGTGEVALSHIRTAADRFGLTVMDTQLGSGSLSFCSATECSDACREILLAHEGHPSLPDCIFGDIREKVHAHGREEVGEVWKAFRLRYSYQVRNGVPHAQAASSLGKEFMRQAWSTLQVSKTRDGIPETSHCYRHGRQCPLRKSTTKGAIKGNISGPTCVDFSILGDRMGWLGEHAKTFACWLFYHAEIEADDWIILENVDNFDESVVYQLVSSQYSVLVLHLDPRNFGFPVSRSRKYLLLLRRNGRLAWCPEIEMDPTTAFEKLFRRPLNMDGRIFFCAPDSVVASFHKDMARKKHLPETQPNGKPWQAKLLMNQTTRNRVREWEEKLGLSAVLVDQSEPSLFLPLPSRSQGRSPT
ncbi:unnamed protein product [Durusdinium trenchii]|uniref:Uncharacterized protein n=1 Tax=Durusdinium trenchii TaxID=1381693 RepID=A0ABP0SKA1_9DINO